MFEFDIVAIYIGVRVAATKILSAMADFYAKSATCQSSIESSKHLHLLAAGTLPPLRGNQAHFVDSESGPAA
jgi:hypothetical protein